MSEGYRPGTLIIQRKVSSSVGSKVHIVDTALVIPPTVTADAAGLPMVSPDHDLATIVVHALNGRGYKGHDDWHVWGPVVES